jgi:hypothetical protein
LVIEIAYSQSTEDLARTVRKWIYGTEGVTKVIIAINIKEKAKPKCRAPWGLSVDQIERYSLSALAHHIQNWHRDNGLPLLGTFCATMSICTRDIVHPNTKTLPDPIWTYDFSLQDPPQPGRLTSSPACSILSEDSRLLTIPGDIQVEIPFQALEKQLRDSLQLYEEDRVTAHAENAKEKKDKQTASAMPVADVQG